MPKHLVIVESPAKARTIERYLGSDYRVLASYGHVRDLPENPGKGKLGVDVDHDFAPEYVIAEDRRKQVSDIEKAAKSADTVFLATDLDREGEAIAWHVAEAAHVAKSKTRRVTFSEITERAIKDAFEHPRGIDENLVDAQQARRIVDRLVGYTLSPLLSRKVRSGLSAGRVQSVAVRLVVEREREIDAFVAREYWTLRALLATERGEEFEAELVRIDGQAIEVGDGDTADRHANALKDLHPRVTSIATKQQKRSPAPPFTTSTLQQEASRKLSFSPKRTMSIAQRLYEGVDTPDGHVGLITYMRTDSVAIAGVAMGEARDVIRARFGDRYTMPKGRVYKTKTKGAQEAHESIRPTAFHRDPDSMASFLKPEELRLYRLIWQRALASQMEAKELETTTVELSAAPYELRASATRVLFDGFSRVYTEGRDDRDPTNAASGPDADAADDDAGGRLPPLQEGESTDVRDVTSTQHFTEPPPRFTEASLIKALEEHGIGRPSTYAATISTIVDRGYVRVEERRLHPEPVAGIVTDLLVEHFKDYVDLEFTAKMEEDLDAVARGERAWVPLLQAFYPPLRDRVAEVRKNTRRRDFTTEETDEVCSLGHPMVIRLGRNGRFLACSLYPEHKESRPLPGEEPEAPVLEGAGETCPECRIGTLVGKRGRFGPFLGCDRYPDCGYIKREGPPPPPPLPFEVTCPKNQDGRLVARRARRTGNVFYGCSNYPKCDYTTNHEPVGALHDTDDGPVARKSAADAGLLCLRCGADIEAPAGASSEALVGMKLPGGPPNPDAIAPKRRGGGGGGGRSGAGRRAGGGRAGAAGGRRRTTRSTRSTSAT
ncbi:MAG TPA: type I DNA topoisomerase [Candidatus Limnocylindrales bacterium]|jgi:DNA topoisomerase-1|nr:type I DNA topoisomerase [Candidatus Limnocylindrales bacterium]